MIVVDNPSRADVEWLEEQINTFNTAATGYDDGRQLAVFVRDPGGTLIAGLHGATWGGCAHIDLLWVAASHRRRGFGRAMLGAVEEEARQRGCRLIVVSSHDFQAPGFYERHGYEVVGVIADKPLGGCEVHLAKRFA